MSGLLIWGIARKGADETQIGAMKNVAWRFNDEGIRCNAVLPGGEDLVSRNNQERANN